MVSLRVHSIRLLAGLLAGPAWSIAAAETSGRPDVVVAHEGLNQNWADAIRRTVSAARSAAVEQFGFNMPETVTVAVHIDASGKTRLFNDGRDRFSLTIRSVADLRRPRESGTFHLYGLCHEVGHLAMYRLIPDHSWMTSAAAEGWAHYLGFANR